MKTLLVCLAVTSTAVAADLKDPAVVVRDWNQAVEQIREPSVPLNNLREQSDALTITPLERIFRADNLTPQRPFQKSAPRDGSPRILPSPRSPGPLYDAPNYRVPDVLPDNMPPDSKLWEYNGRKYWLIPLGPDYRQFPINPEASR